MESENKYLSICGIYDIVLLLLLHYDTLQELSSYLEALNFHKTIKFTSEGSYIEVNFLNATVNKDNQGHIQTALHTQAKDSHLINTFITVCFS